MTDNKPRGVGRPANGDYPIKLFARVSDEHYIFLKSLGYDAISEAIREVISAAMEKREPRGPSSNQ